MDLRLAVRRSPFTVSNSSFGVNDQYLPIYLLLNIETIAASSVLVLDTASLWVTSFT